MGKCNCFRKCFRSLKRKNSIEQEQGHRLIYYGDVPTISSSNDEYLRELASTREQHNQCEDLRTNSRNLDNVPTSGTIQSKRRSITNAPTKDRRQIFPNNLIISSRYTVWNFIPKNIVWEQFRRIVNVYFLIMAIIQASISSPVHPITAALPLAFVISTTAIKQGYEDWLRHKADKNVNDRPVYVVRDQQLHVIKARDVKVGDIVRLEGEDQVPADLLIVGSSDEFLRCQITTANLDGETNLKMRYCPAGLLHLKHERDFSKLHCVVECDQPNTSLYEFNGCLLVPPSRMPLSRMSDSSSFATNKEPSQVINGIPLNPTTFSPEEAAIPLDNVKTKDTLDSESPTMSNFFTVPLSMENMVLRGARVKNTEFIFGLVIYTGKDTRLAQNSKQTSLKRSTIDKKINRFLCVFIAALAVMVILSTCLHYWWEYSRTLDKAYYIEPNIHSRHSTVGSLITDGLETFASFLIIFNYIIPISLYVTVELQKFFDSKFFVWDLEMTCPVSKHPPLCNTSDLNEELGQIEYLFTDKTGTLTENIMQFRHCSIGGKNYDFIDDSLYLRNPEEPRGEPFDIEKDPDIVQFLKVLALCHSVQLMPIRRPSFESTNSKSPLQIKNAKARAASSLFGLGGNSEQAVGILGKWEYQASSPDEKALLESCYRLDVKYLGEKEDELTIDVFGKVETFKRHFVLEFDADRKCMSVVVENNAGEIWLLSKGAESAIIPRCDYGPTQDVLKSVVDFAMMGMRTLAVAKRQLTRQELHSFSHKLKAARRLLNGREDAMKELYRSVESHLTVIGATGVEDQLQDGVPEALQALNAAGIRIWMLTGDKIETGVSVGVACGLITPSSRQFFITSMTDKDQIIRKLQEIKAEVIPEDNTTLIVDGTSLEVAFTACPDLLREVSLLVYRVVCCRMAPLQKAQIVNMVKSSKSCPITAAVGDGANDVAMIQEAHIGIGILGKEGRQAARCADFALARSSFLKKAILVHGHWFYVRLAMLVTYFFYKNIVFIGPQFIFCFYSAFSTQSLYDGMSLMMYNIFYTSCPIFTYGLQEQPFSSAILLKHPFLYRTITRNRLMTWEEFFQWQFFAIWHSLVCFYVPYLAWDFFSPISDWSSFGTLSFCCVVAVTNMKLIIETKFVSGYTIFSHIFSYGAMVLFCSIYSESRLDQLISFMDPGEYRHVYFTLLSQFPFWIVMVLALFIALAPDLLYKVYLNSSFRFYKLWRCVPKMKSSTLKNYHLPIRLSMVFPSSRSGRVAAVSTATLQSYLSREDVT